MKDSMYRETEMDWHGLLTALAPLSNLYAGIARVSGRLPDRPPALIPITNPVNVL